MTQTHTHIQFKGDDKMLMKNQSYTIEEPNRLMNEYNINDVNSNEVINIYFECFRDVCSYSEFLEKNVRIIPKDHELVNVLFSGV